MTKIISHLNNNYYFCDIIHKFLHEVYYMLMIDM